MKKAGLPGVKQGVIKNLTHSWKVSPGVGGSHTVAVSRCRGVALIMVESAKGSPLETKKKDDSDKSDESQEETAGHRFF